MRQTISNLFNKNPLVFIGAVALGVLIIIAIVISYFSKVTAPGNVKTGGDAAAANSPAFLVYKAQPYKPTSNSNTNTLIGADIAFYARKRFSAYNPAKQPAVSFNITTQSTSENADAVILTGKFDKVGDTLIMTFHLLNNDQISTNIVDKSDKTNIDSELPSASAFNRFIATLPISNPNYRIDYVPANGSMSITTYDKGDTYITQAQQLVAQKLGVTVADLTKYNIGYMHPSAINYGDN